MAWSGFVSSVSILFSLFSFQSTEAREHCRTGLDVIITGLNLKKIDGSEGNMPRPRVS
jgi:hypothetical protein